MENIPNILAKDLRIGQEILADIYGDGEHIPLLITDIGLADGLRYDADGYSIEHADTLHTMRGALLRVSGVTLDGAWNECLLIHENDMVLLIIK